MIKMEPKVHDFNQIWLSKVHQSTHKIHRIETVDHLNLFIRGTKIIESVALYEAELTRYNLEMHQFQYFRKCN